MSARATQTALSGGASASSGTGDAPDGMLAHVDRVVDGDTIIVELDGRDERLRYIGVDAPESVKQDYPVECFGPEASTENKRLVDGRYVMLVKDVSDRDQYGRLLRYVYVQDDSTGEWVFVNMRLVEEGYATSVTFPPDVAHLSEFRAAEREARDAGRGLWGSCSTR
ncbi:MAG: thermonuclease family protein [Thermomicrobiales bacterium]|nr:thermonuclease family protein [Thermomicrobiales bacterium]